MFKQRLHTNQNKHGWLPNKIGSFCRVSLFLLALFFCFGFSGCSPSPKTLDYLAMDTYIETTAYGKNADDFLLSANEEVIRLESIFSAHNTKSELSALNNGALHTSEELKELVLEALNLAEYTKGAFDPTLLPLSRLWNLGSASNIPSDEEIFLAKEYVGYENIIISDKNIDLRKSEIDLGGITKGYAADRFIALAKENGVSSAMGSFGGMVAVVGSKPNGSPWKIAIRDPMGNDFAAILNVSDLCISTSGAYERYFTFEGKVYHHILDPKTGYPAESDLLSATVINESGTKADALSTALFVMGESKAVDFCEENGICAVLITKDNRIVSLCGAEVLLSDISEDYIHDNT